MANNNTMTRVDDAKDHVGAKQLVIDSAGDVGQIPFSGRIAAWVNFNGVGGVVVRGSAGIASVVRDGTGLYTINFADNFQDTNYGVLITVGNLNNTSWRAAGVRGNLKFVGSVGINTVTATYALADESDITVMILR